MEVTSISQGTQPLWPQFQSKLDSLIQLVGKPGFVSELSAVTREATGCDRIVAFASAPGERPACVATDRADNAGSQAQNRYLTEFWKVDPLRLVDANPPTHPSYLARLDAMTLSSASYRDNCFTDLQLRSRATTTRSSAGLVLRFNVYFRDISAFDPRIGEYLASTATIVDSLLRRHLSDSRSVHERIDGAKISARLEVAAPELTRRELEVCTHIARGLTSEGIAHELGISLNTVLTYRKRAYSRLNITTQNELMHLLVN